MRRMKQCLGGLVAMLVLLTSIPFAMPVAADTTQTAPAEVTFSVGSVEASVGDIITVPVMVSEDHYLVNGTIAIRYDPTVLELQTVCDDADNPYFEEINHAIFNNRYMWAFALTEPGVATFSFATSSDQGTTAGGTMFELTFKVLNADANGTLIWPEIFEMRSNDGVTNGGEDYDAAVTTVNGTVTLETAPAEVTFTVGSVEASVGDIIKVPVMVSENHYMVSGTLLIEYDPVALELQTVCDNEDNPYFETCNPAIFGKNYMWGFELKEEGIAKFAFAASGPKGTTAGGTMFELTFKVRNEYADGTMIECGALELCSNDGVTNGGESYNTVCHSVPGIVTLETAPAEVTFTVGSVTASVGDIITVPVMVSENHCMVSGTLLIEYDPAGLELLTVCDNEDNPYFEECNPAIFGKNCMWGFELKEEGIAKFAFAASGATGTTAGGTMFELTFKVRNEYANGSSIECGALELCSNDGVTNGGEDYDAVVNTVPGIVTLKKTPMVGDIDGDGRINTVDALRLYAFAAGRIADLGGMDLRVADYDSNGVINMMDVLRVFRIAGGY